MLLDPFEKQFNVPAAPIQLTNGHGRKREIAGDEGEGLVSFFVPVLYASKMFGEVLAALFAREFNRPVEDKTG